MSLYGSAMVDCVLRPIFIVWAGDGTVLGHFDTGDPVGDLARAKACADGLADKVFLAASVEAYWTTEGRTRGASA
jgi:hypothetical protein